MNDRKTNDQALVSQVTIQRVGSHDRVAVWNRASKAGDLVVVKGDGPRLAARLLGFDDESEEAHDLAADFENHDTSAEPVVYEA